MKRNALLILLSFVLLSGCAISEAAQKAPEVVVKVVKVFVEAPRKEKKLEESVPWYAALKDIAGKLHPMGKALVGLGGMVAVSVGGTVFLGKEEEDETNQ